MVEYNLAKVGVAGSIPVSRSFYLVTGGLQLCRNPVYLFYKQAEFFFTFLKNPKLFIEISHKTNHNMQ